MPWQCMITFDCSIWIDEIELDVNIFRDHWTCDISCTCWKRTLWCDCINDQSPVSCSFSPVLSYWPSNLHFILIFYFILFLIIRGEKFISIGLWKKNVDWIERKMYRILKSFFTTRSSLTIVACITTRVWCHWRIIRRWSSWIWTRGT